MLFSHLFYPTVFLDGVFSEAYERAVMGTILMAKVIDSVVPLPMYSATMLCCTIQTKVVERLLLREWPSPYVNGPHVTTQGTICKFCTHLEAEGKLPPPSTPIYMADPKDQGGSLWLEQFTLSTPLLLGGVFSQHK